MRVSERCTLDSACCRAEAGPTVRHRRLTLGVERKPEPEPAPERKPAPEPEPEPEPESAPELGSEPEPI